MKKKKGQAKLQRELRHANRRLQSMRSSGYGNLTVIDRALAEFGKITKQGKKEKFVIDGKLNNRQSRLIIKQLNKFLQSAWTTESGRADILEKRVNAFMNPNGKYNLSKEETLKLFDIFESDAYHKAIEKKMLDSNQVIDMMRNSNASAKKFDEVLTSLVKSETQPDESRDYVESRL